MTVESKFPTVQTQFASDPRVLPRYFIKSTNVSIVNAAGVTSALSSVTGFTEVALRGTAVDSDFSAGVSKQIASLTGPCIVSHIIGPALTNISDSALITVVVDGVTFSLTGNTATVAAYRNIIGVVRDIGGGPGVIGTVTPLQTNAETQGYKVVVGHSGEIPTPDEHAEVGTAGIFARNTLTVSIQTTSAVTATANVERQSGVIFRSL